MNKEEIFKSLGFIGKVALGTIVGISVLDFAKRQLIKKDFTQPLNVTKEN